MVCSKSEGRDISGRSFSFFLFAARDKGKMICSRLIRRSLKKTKQKTFIHQCKADGWHVGKGTHSYPPRGKWSAGGLSCFSLQEPLEAVWRRDSTTKSLGNYCSFSREGPVVSPQYRHYQTSLVALTKSWGGRGKRQRGPRLEGLRVDQTGRRQHLRKENQHSERQTKQSNYSFFGLFFF